MKDNLNFVVNVSMRKHLQFCLLILLSLGLPFRVFGDEGAQSLSNPLDYIRAQENSVAPKIPPAFWNYTPRLERIADYQTKTLTSVRCRENLITFGKKYAKFNGQDESEDPEWTEFIRKLKVMGFVPEKGTEAGFFRFVEIENLHICYWFFESSVYAIFPDDPYQAVDVFDFGGKYPGRWNIDQGFLSPEKIGPGRYRFSEEVPGKYDATASETTIVDVDLKKQMITSLHLTGFLKDLDRDGKKELVLYFCTESKFTHYIWPYVFNWNGKTWIDKSWKYPNFYKTEVLTNLKNLEKCCLEKRYYDTGRTFVSLLEEAAKAGGPNAFKK